MAALWHALEHHEGAASLAKVTLEISVRRAGRLLADCNLRMDTPVLSAKWCGAAGSFTAACEVLLVRFNPELWHPVGAMLLWQTAPAAVSPGAGGASCSLLCGAHIVARAVFCHLAGKAQL